MNIGDINVCQNQINLANVRIDQFDNEKCINTEKQTTYRVISQNKKPLLMSRYVKPNVEQVEPLIK